MKLSNPFGSRNYRITQTTHGVNANNPNDLKSQRAVDALSDFNGNDPIYAQADGVVKNVVTYSGKMWQSFLRMKYTGLSHTKAQVHVVPYKGIKSGTKVLRGQRIGTLHPTVINSKTGKVIHSKHLHDAFEDPTLSGKAPNPFDYLDRGTKVIATHPEILATNWFKKGKFQWNQFKDLHFKGVLPTGRYELTQSVWIKQKASTEAVNFKKCSKGAVGKVLGDVVVNGGYQWQYISFSNVAGWIPNHYLVATVKSVTTHNLSVITPKSIEAIISIPEVPTTLEPTKQQEESAIEEVKILKEDIETIQEGADQRYSRLESLYNDSKTANTLLDQEVKRLNGVIADKDLIILSLRKKRNMTDISKVFTHDEIIKYLNSDSLKFIKRFFPEILLRVKDFLQTILKKLQKQSN